MKRKLKLTKLTIANLDRIKGGHVCGCPATDPVLGFRDQMTYPPLITVEKTICPAPVE